MRAHQIKNKKIINTIEIDSLDAMPDLVEATEGGIGWSFVDGVFTPPVDTTTAEEKAIKLREERTAKLAATDWHGLTDVTMTAEMAAYRQALRDVPAQVGFPSTITWPTKP